MKLIVKATHVPLSRKDAFDLFIREIDLWWPKDSHAPFGPDAKLLVEARKNGDIVEISPDGARNLWGRILAWEPGHFLAFTWFPTTTEDHASVIAISFTATPEGTRVDLTHGGFDVLGETVDAVSTTYLLGWDLVLGSYCYAASRSNVVSTTCLV